ncbi:effector-associated domain 2-containing protein [Streptomyces sp. MUM 178J]|uniref:effector-associated domain 2-containing protein n=1 Tax=Streptomyces sp. MUM 178J TaxID=2791991 RepID=UPI001F04F0A3|nr:trypsin-like peptidase domain-containing protein [Streptomyces sp. MUM 178J]WRQ78026.1 trypsin-like peptidase domain-containing protein [Streptomyces sp. MUM 178J]
MSRADSGGLPGLAPGQVAEILVSPSAGHAGRRGSGYRVGRHWVLTAAHVVTGPASRPAAGAAGPVAGTAVQVRFDADRPGEWTADARVIMAAESADAALLEICGPLAPGAPDVATPRYGRVPDADAVLTCSVMGFPRFKLRDDRMRMLDDGSPSQYRDSCHAAGTVSVLSNRREGTLELTVPAPPADPDAGRSPWEGMSGAALWHGGVLIGLVSAHHRGDGPGRLAATRVDRWYELLGRGELDLLHRLAGLPPAGELVGCLPAQSPPDAASGLPAAACRPAVPPGTPLRELDGLLTALTAAPSLRDAVTRGQILDGIRPEVAANSPRSTVLRVDLLGILRTCLRYPGALDQLLDALRTLEGDSAEMIRVDGEAAALARRHSAADRAAR